MGGALGAEMGCAVASNCVRGSKQRRPARSPSPVAWTRGNRVVTAASWTNGANKGGGVPGTGVTGAAFPERAAPTPGQGNTQTSRPRRHASRVGERLITHAAGDDNNNNINSNDAYGYDGGQTEVMKSVAERVKAARELAKRLASREEELAARNRRVCGSLPARTVQCGRSISSIDRAGPRASSR